MFDDPAKDYFVIRNITLPAGQSNFYVVLRIASFLEDDVSLTVSADGAVWKPLVYTGASAYNTWDRDDGGLHARAACPKLVDSPCADGYGARLRVEFRRHRPDGRGRRTAGGLRHDRQGSTAGPNCRLCRATPTPTSSIHTYWTTTVTSKQYLRNYTYCYDTYRHCPLWIAHPQRRLLRGGVGAYGCLEKDEYMTDAEQAIIYPCPKSTEIVPCRSIPRV